MNAPFVFELWYSALPILVAAATLTWLLSLPLRNVNAANSSWSLMLFASGVCYAMQADPRTPRLALALWMLAIWAARLAVYLTARNAGRGEDPRNRALRARHPPFWLQSLYRVFWPQAALAWIVSLPLLGAFASLRPLGVFDALGAVLWLVGFVFEAGSDWQLARFRRRAGNGDAVLDRGFWRYTRHPNYFGECCIWWGFMAMALGAGAWWALPGPLLLTWLMRVAGVRQGEAGIGKRRPQYADYVLKTNAFFPAPPRK